MIFVESESEVFSAYDMVLDAFVGACTTAPVTHLVNDVRYTSLELRRVNE